MNKQTLPHVHTRQPHMGMTINPQTAGFTMKACSLLGGIPGVYEQPQGQIFEALVHLQLAKLLGKWLVLAS